MTSLILPPKGYPQGPRKRSTYCTILTDVARAAADAETAVDLFGQLLSGNSSSGFAKFDAHVGETGCHIRATMFREMFTSHKNLSRSAAASTLPTWVSTAKEQYHAIRRNAETICLHLTKHRVDPRDFGIKAKSDVPESFIRAVSGDNPTAFKSIDGYGYTRMTTAMKNNMAKIPTMEWNPNDPRILVRFIVYSFVLSKYKQFLIKDGRFTCRLRHDLACDEGQEHMKPFWDMRNGDYKVAKPLRVESEFTALRIWISELSCAWLRYQSYRLSAESIYSTMVRTSVLTARTGLAASACFPTFLLLRDLWATSEGGVMLVDRHYCSQGFHYHVLECKLRLLRQSNTATVCSAVHWNTKETSVPGLSEASNDNPYIVVLGSSINGPNSAYTNRTLAMEANPSLTRMHNDAGCVENQLHAYELRSTDHDRLSLAFFAAHKAYCIPLEQTDTESATIEMVVSTADQNAYALEFKTLWEKSAAEIDKLGAGPESLRNFAWQHVFTETKYGLAELLTEWQANEDLMPIGA